MSKVIHIHYPSYSYNKPTKVKVLLPGKQAKVETVVSLSQSNEFLIEAEFKPRSSWITSHNISPCMFTQK